MTTRSVCVVTDANVLINLMHVSRLRRWRALGEARILGTPELFVMAIQGGLLTIDQADADKLALERHRFKLRFASFRELLS